MDSKRDTVISGAPWKLRRFFYIANLHWNNFSCDAGITPFQARAYEVLLVNKRIGVPDTAKPVTRSLLDRPNNPELPDCQAGASN